MRSASHDTSSAKLFLPAPFGRLNRIFFEIRLVEAAGGTGVPHGVDSMEDKSLDSSDRSSVSMDGVGLVGRWMLGDLRVNPGLRGEGGGRLYG